MATSDWSCVSKDNLNFSRLCKLLVDGGTKVLRDVFNRIHPPLLLKTSLIDPKNHNILKTLQSRRVIYPEQWKKLYPTGGSTVDSQSFDITLLCLLLRSICNFPAPAAGWKEEPAPTSTNTEDDVVRIKLFRNQVYGHITEAAITDAEFEKYWNEISTALVRIGGLQYQADIDGLKIVTMDPEDEKYYIQCLKEWDTYEDRVVKKLDEFEKNVRSVLQTCCISGGDKENKRLDVDLCSKNLKSSTKRQTEFQPKLMASHSFSSLRTDDIFTNLLIQRGQKPLRQPGYISRSDVLAEYSKPTETSIKTCQDIFITSEEENTSKPKSILAIGKPGIGKTLFCQKLVRDWANDVLFTNESSSKTVGFDFVYLLTFRQLNLLGDEELNLREVLNCSPYLDEHSNIDESLFEYIIEHQERVLFLLDGYDEYAHCSNSEANPEEKYANNPRNSMPVDALVSKLLKKKVFSDATVMVTSRPQEDDGLGSIHFDAIVEIAGFSPEQVKEFIGKYFHSKPGNIGNQVMEHIVNNEHLLSLAHIPMLCFLMCLCLECRIKSNSGNDLPNTITGLYSEVVKIFEMKHHSKSKFRTSEIPQRSQVPSVVEDTLDKLSKLAAETFIQKKFIFQEDDLQKFNITAEDVEALKASGLLTCGPGIRKTAIEMTTDYCFSHFTLHEYFAARHFVRNREIMPELSWMVFQFMAGLLVGEKNENMIEQLMKVVVSHSALVPFAQCLYEYHDKDFGLRMVKSHHVDFCTKDGTLDCGTHYLSEVDCSAVSYLLNLISEFYRLENKAQEQKISSLDPFLINGLACVVKTAAGANRIWDSLGSKSCPITSLKCRGFDDELLINLGKVLSLTNITALSCSISNVTDAGLHDLSLALPMTKITKLCLIFTDTTRKQRWQCSTTFEITTNFIRSEITFVGFQDFLKALPSTWITVLELTSGNITDEVLKHLCEVMPSTEITTLILYDHLISTQGLKYISEKIPSTKLTTLEISYHSSDRSFARSLHHVFKNSVPSTVMCLEQGRISFRF